jgi:hypothetical protein
LVGHYTTADFHPGNDGSGDLEITDPPVIEQKAGSVPATITVLEVKVPDTGNVTFAGPTGTLWLDRPSIFTGKVANFGAQERIDLPGIPFGRLATRRTAATLAASCQSRMERTSRRLPEWLRDIEIDRCPGQRLMYLRNRPHSPRLSGKIGLYRRLACGPRASCRLPALR